MTDTIQAKRPTPLMTASSKICTAVAISAIATGTGVFISSGGIELMGAVTSWFGGLSAPEMSLAVMLALFALFTAGCIAWGEAFFYIFLCASIYGTGALTLSTVAIGWSRLLGIYVFEGLPPITTAAVGTGALAIAFGAVVLAYCRTPASPSPEGGETPKNPRTAKFVAATMVGLVLIVVPGVAATFWGEPLDRQTPTFPSVEFGLTSR